MSKKSISALIIASSALSSLAHASDTFSPKDDRGQARFELLSPGKITETCIVPKPFPGSEKEYGDKAIKKAEKLCSLDFYGNSGPNKDIVTVSCPKLFSTNPSVEIQEVPAGTTREAYFDSECKKEQGRAGEKLAKFKQSISCSFTPSILAYYHVNKALGDSLEVPAGVIRTMDIQEHKKITTYARKFAKDTILATWGSWVSAEGDPKNYKKKEAVFTQELDQIYGALIQNPKGESKYSEINKGTPEGMMATQPFKDLTNSTPVEKMVSKSLDSAAQKITIMKDISNMLVIDYIMGQQDRNGNIASVDYIYSWDAAAQKLDKRELKKKDQPAAGEVVVKEMLLKDNDCGFRDSDNDVKKLGMLQKVRHMAPKNYKRLQKLAIDAQTPEVGAYLQKELLFTSADLKTFRDNSASAAKILKDSCKAGKLLLDLDLEAFLKGEAAPTDCE